jgi:hypothetical protein
MYNLNDISLFLFIFSILSFLRILIKFTSALLQTPPQKLELGSGELIFNGLTISYIITYIITNI